jgi:hypothetical protein
MRESERERETRRSRLQDLRIENRDDGSHAFLPELLVRSPTPSFVPRDSIPILLDSIVDRFGLEQQHAQDASPARACLFRREIDKGEPDVFALFGFLARVGVRDLSWTFPGKNTDDDKVGVDVDFDVIGARSFASEGVDEGGGEVIAVGKVEL